MRGSVLGVLKLIVQSLKQNVEIVCDKMVNRSICSSAQSVQNLFEIEMTMEKVPGSCRRRMVVGTRKTDAALLVNYGPGFARTLGVILADAVFPLLFDVATIPQVLVPATYQLRISHSRWNDEVLIIICNVKA